MPVPNDPSMPIHPDIPGQAAVSPAGPTGTHPGGPQPLQAPTDRAHAIAKAVEQAWAQRVQHSTAGQAYGNPIAAFILMELQKIGPGLIQDVIQALEGGLMGGLASRPPGQP